MSETKKTDQDKSETNDNNNLDQLKSLTLNQENEILEPKKCTPTLDYLQVP